MGNLYKAAVMQKKLKRDFILGKLRALNVTVSQEGLPLDELDYEDLKYEYVLASFREIDSETSSNAWF
ncbi:hypothetical protein MKX78_08780 [Cytobacillus sp. FSL R5-0569]|uniref:hypothetical protein n=1 Tax=Cytobacillus sp. FSL R5-0569 TaxID=2921649 RepID=UPI0030F87202